MILNAEDDPVCHIQNFEPYKELIVLCRMCGGDHQKRQSLWLL
jgi:hypothetical protein